MGDRIKLAKNVEAVFVVKVSIHNPKTITFKGCLGEDKVLLDSVKFPRDQSMCLAGLDLDLE